MSYEILYDTAFIRTEHGIVPMILSGSNNCTEIKVSRDGRQYEARERHWWAFVPKPLPVTYHPEQTMLKVIDEITRERPDCEFFMRHGKWMYYRNWLGWFKNACRAAYSLEEYLKQNRHQSFEATLLLYPKEGKATRRMSKYLHSSDELEKWLDEANAEAVKLRSPDLSVWVDLSFTVNEPIRMPRPVKGSVVVKSRYGGYVCDYITDKSLSYDNDPRKAKVFASVDDAKRELGYHWGNLRFLSAENQVKEKNYVLRFNGGKRLHGYYFGRRTRNTLYPAYIANDAHHFATRHEAIRCAKQLAQRYSVGKQFVIVKLKEVDATEECINLEDLDKK